LPKQLFSCRPKIWRHSESVHGTKLEQMIRKTDLWKVGLQWDARGAAYKHAAKRGDRTAGLLHCVTAVSYTIIIPTKCTRFLLLKSQDITICNFVLYICPYMFQPACVIFRGLNASAWLKLLLITIY
jgi:hypothetical protein